MPTGGGMRHLYSPLGTLHWAPYNQQEHFFMAGKSEKWLRCIAAMKRCEEWQNIYPSTCEFCRHCGEKLQSFKTIVRRNNAKLANDGRLNALINGNDILGSKTIPGYVSRDCCTFLATYSSKEKTCNSESCMFL